MYIHIDEPEKPLSDQRMELHSASVAFYQDQVTVGDFSVRFYLVVSYSNRVAD